MNNSLLSSALWEPIRNAQLDLIRADQQRQDEAVFAFLAKHPGVPLRDIYLKAHWQASPGIETQYTAHARTAEDKWLDWQSNNHGWGT
jgi:hypothetical protein